MRGLATGASPLCMHRIQPGDSEVSSNQSSRDLNDLYISMKKGEARGEPGAQERSEVVEEPMHVGADGAALDAFVGPEPAASSVSTRERIRSSSQYADLRGYARITANVIGTMSCLAGLMIIGVAVASKALSDEKAMLITLGVGFAVAVPLQLWFMLGMTEAFIDICDAQLRGVSVREEAGSSR